jgi:hypothetical protein
MKVFAIGILRWSYYLASDYGTFLLVIRINLIIRNGPYTNVIEKTSFVKIKVYTRVARELRANHRYPARAQGTKIGGDIIFLRRSKNKLAHICAHRSYAVKNNNNTKSDQE